MAKDQGVDGAVKIVRIVGLVQCLFRTFIMNVGRFTCLFSLCILIFLCHILVSLSLQRIFFVLGAKFVLAILY